MTETTIDFKYKKRGSLRMIRGSIRVPGEVHEVSARILKPILEKQTGSKISKVQVTGLSTFYSLKKL